MPIEEALEKIPENGKAGIISQPTILLPVDKCMTAYVNFAKATYYIGSWNETVTKDCPQLIETCEKFLLFSEFYTALRKNLDNLVIELNKWKKSFPRMFPVEKPNPEKQPEKTPRAIHKWIVSETEQAFHGIDNSSYPTEIEKIYHNQIAPLGNRINDIWSELYNAQSLLDTIILGKGLSENVIDLNERFTVRHVPYIGHTPVPPGQYVSEIEKLLAFARDKEIVTYSCCNGEVGNLQDNSPVKPPIQSKKSIFKRLLEDYRR